MNSHTRIIKKMASHKTESPTPREYCVFDSFAMEGSTILPDWIKGRVTRTRNGEVHYVLDTGHEISIPRNWVVIQTDDRMPLVIPPEKFKSEWEVRVIEEVGEPPVLEQKTLVRVSLFAGDEMHEQAALVPYDGKLNLRDLLDRVIEYMEAGAPLAMPKFVISDESSDEDIERLASETMTGQIIPVSKSQLQAFVSRSQQTVPVNDPLDPPVMNMEEYQRLTRELAYYKTEYNKANEEFFLSRKEVTRLSEVVKTQSMSLALERVRKDRIDGEAFLKHLFDVIHVAADGITEDFIKRIKEEIAIGAAEGFPSESVGKPGYNQDYID